VEVFTEDLLADEVGAAKKLASDSGPGSPLARGAREQQLRTTAYRSSALQSSCCAHGCQFGAAPDAAKRSAG